MKSKQGRSIGEGSAFVDEDEEVQALWEHEDENVHENENEEDENCCEPLQKQPKEAKRDGRDQDAKREKQNGKNTAKMN